MNETKRKYWNKCEGGYYGYVERYDLLLNEIYQKTDNHINIANKYNFPINRISQIKKQFSQLKYKPEIVNGKIKCQKCDKQESLVIHHNHNTDETIAILCRECNHKVGNNDLEYINRISKGIEFMNKICTLIESEGWLSVSEIFKKLEQGYSKQGYYYYVRKLADENRIKSKIKNACSYWHIKKKCMKYNDVIYWV